MPLLHQSTDKATGGITGFKNYKGDGIWLENRKRDAARGDGEQENGIWLENRKRDAARGDGEQENGICLENRNQRTRRGETRYRRTGLDWRT